jgi:hypothetical protein
MLDWIFQGVNITSAQWTELMEYRWIPACAGMTVCAAVPRIGMTATAGMMTAA